MSKTARTLAAAAVAAVLCAAAAPLAQAAGHSAPPRTTAGIGWDIATPATTPATSAPADGIGWD